MRSTSLTWIGVVRLGLVQSALGAIVALTTSTLNRIMVVEAAMPAVLPAALVAWHYLVQLSRPRWGHGSDMGRRRTPWIIGGMGALSLGAILATDATLMMTSAPLAGILIGIVAYALIGGGAGASGTSLLALLATSVAPQRRPASAAITWIMMIAGIVVSAGVTGTLLQPFSAQRLAFIASGVAGLAFLLTLGAVWGVEGEHASLAGAETGSAPIAASPKRAFRVAAAEVWADPTARRFTLFVFVSMLAYSAQELILEPFAGLVFGLTPGESAQLSSLQHGGVLLGMILFGLLGSRLGARKAMGVRAWTMAGCIGSAVALTGMAAASLVGPTWPLAPTVFILGFANGVFAVSAVGAMMSLASAGRTASEGVRMGVWGAAQACAFALGGFLGAMGVDVTRGLLHQAGPAFLVVFCAEAAVFLVAAWLASQLGAAAVSSAAAIGPEAPALLGRVSG